jgi:hypothetical protein
MYVYPLQVEAYMTLSAAFEELAGAAAGTATEARTRAELAEAGFEETKRIEVYTYTHNTKSNTKRFEKCFII